MRFPRAALDHLIMAEAKVAPIAAQEIVKYCCHYFRLVTQHDRYLLTYNLLRPSPSIYGVLQGWTFTFDQRTKWTTVLSKPPCVAHTSFVSPTVEGNQSRVSPPPFVAAKLTLNRFHRYYKGWIRAFTKGTCMRDGSTTEFVIPSLHSE